MRITSVHRSIANATTTMAVDTLASAEVDKLARECLARGLSLDTTPAREVSWFSRAQPARIFLCGDEYAIRSALSAAGIIPVNPTTASQQGAKYVGGGVG